MRRVALTLTLGWYVALLFACGVGVFSAHANQAQAFVSPDARNVQIVQRGPTRMLISYMLPAGQSVSDVSNALEDQGWRLTRMQRHDQHSITIVLSRRSFFGVLREVAQFHLRTDNRAIAEIHVNRCLMFDRNMRCS
jgi:hypothetical protein